MVGRHGHDLRRTISLWKIAQSWEMRTIHHIHKTSTRMGILSVSPPGWPSHSYRCLSFKVYPQIAEKVKLFFFEYARNRHKMTTLTPSYHAVRIISLFTFDYADMSSAGVV